jgi:hypothetical protein
MTEDPKPNGPCAPYGPFSTFETALNHLAALKGIPPKIDRSVFPSMGGDAKTHTLNAFRFFGLIDEKGNPNPALSELALNKEGRKQAVRKLIKERYPNVTEGDLGTMTIPQLDSKLGEKSYNVSGGTRQKARSFLIRAAEFSGIPLSGLLTSKGPRGPRQKRNKKNEQPRGGGDVSGKDAADGAKDHHKQPPVNPDIIRMPIALAPDRVAHVELPKDWNDKDAKKLLDILKLTLDING